MGWNDHIDWRDVRCRDCGVEDSWQFWNGVAKTRYSGSWGRELGLDPKRDSRCPHCGSTNWEALCEEGYPMNMFGGDTFSEPLDGDRLRIQLNAVYSFMFDAHWDTLHGISAATGAPEASVSARLRDLRKPKFGGHTVQRQRVPNGNGLHVYRLLVNKTGVGTDETEEDDE